MILGSESLRDKEFARHELENFRSLGAADEKLGAILNEREFWNILANDAVMLGVIRKNSLTKSEVWICTMKPSPGNSQIPVSMLSKDKKSTLDDNILWDDKEKRLRVAGREIAQLMSAGYQVDPDVPSDFGICLRCKNPEKLSEVTLTTLCRAAETTTLKQIRKFLEGGNSTRDSR